MGDGELWEGPVVVGGEFAGSLRGQLSHVG